MIELGGEGVFFNALIVFGVPTKLGRMTKMSLSGTYSNVSVGKYLSETFAGESGIKQGDALSPLLFNFVLEYAITKVQEDQVGLKLDGPYQMLVYAEDVNLFEDNIDTIKKTQKLFGAGKEVGLEVNTEKTKYTYM
jgi:hypothetical protein